MADNDSVPERILSSDAVRASSTVRIVADTIGIGHEKIELRRELYNTNTQNWIAHLQRVANNWQQVGDERRRLLICGHNPTLDSLANALSIQPLRATEEGKYLTTATVAKLRFDGPIGRSAGDLIAFVRPTELDGFTV